MFNLAIDLSHDLSSRVDMIKGSFVIGLQERHRIRHAAKEEKKE
jgi:hypothetical protein